MLYCLIRKVATLDDPQAWSSCELLDSDFVDHRPALLITPKSSSRAWYNRSQSMAFEIFGTKVSDDIYTNIPHYSTTSPLSMPLYAHSIRIISSYFPMGFATLFQKPGARRAKCLVGLVHQALHGIIVPGIWEVLQDLAEELSRCPVIAGNTTPISRKKVLLEWRIKLRRVPIWAPRIVIQCALTSWKTGHTHGKKCNILLGNMFWGSFGTMQPSASLNQPTNTPTNQPRHFGKDWGNRIVLPSEKVGIPLPSLTHYLNLFDKVGTCLRNLFLLPLLPLSLSLPRSLSRAISIAIYQESRQV